MPNNVTNRFTVSGAPDDVGRFFAAIDGGADEKGQPLYIDFNRIKPMPEALAGIKAGSDTDRALDYYVLRQIEKHGAPAVMMALGDYGGGAVYRRLPETLARRRHNLDAGDMPELLKLGEQCFGNIRAYGAPTWYEWRNQNWGTKWNAYGQERIDDDTLQFYTANAGVPELLRGLSAQFPDLTMSYAYADDDWGNNAGEYRFNGGEVDYEFLPEDGSQGARRIAEELLGPLETEDEGEDGWELGDDD